MAKGVKNNDTEKKMRFTKEVFGMGLILFSVLSLMCLVAGKLIYPVGEIVSGFFLGVFGYYSFIFLLLMVYFGLCMLFSRPIFGKKNNFNFLAFNVLLLAGFLLVHLLTFSGQLSQLSDSVSLAYGGGKCTFQNSSVGGVFLTIINYPMLLVLNKVGVSLIWSLIMVVCVTYFVLKFKYSSAGVRQNVKRQKKPKRTKEKTQGENNSNANLGLEAQGFDFAVNNQEILTDGQPKRKPSGLFVFGDNSFMTKTKKDLKNEQNSNFNSSKYNIAFGMPKGSEDLITHQPQKNYSDTYSNDLDKKLEYIKTPPKVNLDNLNENPMGDRYNQNDNYSTYLNNKEKNSSGEIRRDVYVIKDDNEKPARPISAFDRVADSSRGVDLSRDIDSSRNVDSRFSRENPSSFNRVENPFDSYSINNSQDFGDSLYRPNVSRDPRRNVRDIEEIREDIPTSENKVYTPNVSYSERGRVDDAFQKPIANAPEFDGFVSGENASFDNDALSETSTAFSSRKTATQNQDAYETPSRVTRYSDFAQRKDETRADLQDKNTEISRVNTERVQTTQTTQTANATQSSHSVTVEEKPNPYDLMPADFRYRFPPLNLLEDYRASDEEMERAHNKQIARAEKIVEVFNMLHIEAKVEDIIFGPTVTRFVVSVPPSVKIKTVTQAQADLKFWLESPSDILMLAPIPGTSKIGIEVPNDIRKTVGLKSVLSSKEFKAIKDESLTFVLGQDIIGTPVLLNILSMPHLLVAGSTGTGKSACLNSLLISLFYRYSPDELRLILVDPKQVEFSIYAGMPHLMFNEIIFEPSKALAMLDWANQEMARRYGLLRERNCRKITEYNSRLAPGEKKMPYIVIIIDEFAQLIMSAGDKKNLENKVGTLAQLARAAGIHLIFSTQRPSADILDGTIKNNFTSKICFKTSNNVSSSVVLGETGAEKLLGRGDVLYQTTEMPNILRAQGAFIDEKEVERVVDYIKTKNKAYFDEKALEMINQIQKDTAQSGADDGEISQGDDSTDPNAIDEVYLKALRQVIRTRNASKTSLQTKLSIGYPKAAKIVDWMERKNFISPAVDNKTRKINITREEYEELFGAFDDDLEL